MEMLITLVELVHIIYSCWNITQYPINMYNYYKLIKNNFKEEVRKRRWDQQCACNCGLGQSCERLWSWEGSLGLCHTETRRPALKPSPWPLLAGDRSQDGAPLQGRQCQQMQTVPMEDAAVSPQQQPCSVTRDRSALRRGPGKRTQCPHRRWAHDTSTETEKTLAKRRKESFQAKETGKQKQRQTGKEHTEKQARDEATPSTEMWILSWGNSEMLKCSKQGRDW